MYIWTGRQTGIQMNRKIGKQKDKWTDGLFDRSMDKHKNR
jgi:hypothetical protein